MSGKVLVIGLDGATWNLLMPWIKEGELPNLKRLVEGGVYGDLESSIPPVTFPAWKCYSTGKNPGKLGVYGFVDIDFESKKIMPKNSTSFKSWEMWDYMGKEGLRVGIINMPTTFPPKEVNGFMISFGFATRGYAFPEEIERELEEKYDYKVIPDYYVTRDRKDLDEAKRVIKSGFDFTKDKISDLDFVHLTVFLTDVIQHFLWGSEDIKDVWKCIDENIGDLLNSLNEDWNVILISDHGFVETKAYFFLNTWLERNGYLRFRRSLDFGDVLAVLDKIGFRFDVLYRVLKRTQVFLLLTKILPEERQRRIRHMIPGKRWGRELEGMEGKIDWDRSRAIYVAHLIYLNSNQKDNLQKTKEELVRELEEVRNPKTGEKVIKKVCRKEDIYFGQYLQEAPDLVIEPTDGYVVRHALGSDVVFDFDFRDRWKATHAREGIFVAYGSDIKEGREIKGARIVDLAPTVLHMMGVPIPEDMDGRVLREIFKEKSGPVERMMQYQEGVEEKRKELRVGEEEERVVKDRLRSLGYLG